MRRDQMIHHRISLFGPKRTVYIFLFDPRFRDLPQDRITIRAEAGSTSHVYRAGWLVEPFFP